MGDAHRSGRPINLTLEVLGDKWSLLILREFMAELREAHLAAPARPRSKSEGPLVAARLQAAYEAVAARCKKPGARKVR